VVTGDRLNNGNFTGVATRARRRGDLGGDDLDRPGDTVEAGRRKKKTREGFPIFKFIFLFDFPCGWNNNWKKCLVISEKCEILHGDRFEYLTQLLYWTY
jgi:hypothetical protein